MHLKCIHYLPDRLNLRFIFVKPDAIALCLRSLWNGNKLLLILLLFASLWEDVHDWCGLRPGWLWTDGWVPDGEASAFHHGDFFWLLFCVADKKVTQGSGCNPA